jgi:hypothetical protein
MIGVYREFEGCMRLRGYVLRRLRVLALPPVTEALIRQIYFTGASGTAGMVLRGAFLGTLILIGPGRALVLRARPRGERSGPRHQGGGGSACFERSARR